MCALYVVCVCVYWCVVTCVLYLSGVGVCVLAALPTCDRQKYG